MELLIAFLAFFGIAGWSDATITYEKLEKAKAELTVLQAKAAQTDTLKAQNETLQRENESLRAAIEKIDQTNANIRNQFETVVDERDAAVAHSKALGQFLKEVLKERNELTVAIATLNAENEALRRDNEIRFNLAQMAGPLAVKVQEKEEGIKLREFFIKHLEARVIETDGLYNYWRGKAEERRQENVKLSGELDGARQTLAEAERKLKVRTIWLYGLVVLLLGMSGLAGWARGRADSISKIYEGYRQSFTKYFGEDFRVSDYYLTVEGVNFKIHCERHPSHPLNPAHLKRHMERAHHSPELHSPPHLY